MGRFSLLPVVATLLSLGAGAPALAAGASRQASAISVSPREGGQGSTFTIGYAATDVGDDGPDDGFQTLTLFGPPGSPCEGDVSQDPGSPRRFASVLSGQFFGDGPALFRVGTDPRRAGARTSAAAWRLVQSWCPGRYLGQITEDYATEGAATRNVGTFDFDVAPTRRSAGAFAVLRLDRYNELERLGSDYSAYDHRYAVRPRRGPANRHFEVSFPVSHSHTVAVDVVPPSSRCTRRLLFPVHVRRGRATIAFTDRLPTGRRTPHRFVFHTGRHTCAGTWSVFLQDSFGDVGLSFTVTP